MFQTIKQKYQERVHFPRGTFVFLCIFLILGMILAIILSYSVYLREIGEMRVQSHSNVSAEATWNDIRIGMAEAVLDSLQYNDDVIKYAVTGEFQHLAAICNMLGAYEVALNQLGVRLGILDLQRQNSVTAEAVNAVQLTQITLPEGMGNTEYTASDDSELYLSNIQIQGSTFYKQRSYSGGVVLVFFYFLSDDQNVILSADLQKGSYVLLYKATPIFIQGEEMVPEELYRGEYGLRTGDDYVEWRLTSMSDASFSYLYVYPKPSHYKYLGFTLGCWLLFSLVGLLISVMLAKYFSRPIQEIFFKLQGYNSALQGKSDFSESMNSIFQDIDRLQKEKQENEKGLQNKFLSDLCRGNLNDIQIRHQLKHYSLSILEGRCTFLLLQVVGSEELVEQIGVDGMYYLKNDLIELLEPILPEFYSFYDTYDSIGLIVAGDVDFRSRQSMDELLERLQSEFGFTIKIYLGETGADYRQLVRQYQKVMLMLRDPYIYQVERNVYHTNELELGRDENIHYTLEMERYLIEYVINAKTESAHSLVCSIVERNIHSNTAFSAMRQLRRCFEITVIRILDYIGKAQDEVYPGGVIYPKHLTGTHDFAEYFWQMFLPLFAVIPKPQDDPGQLYQQIDDYILKHLKDNIGLADLAEYLNYTTGYTSKLFKEVFGQNFKAYVNSCRVRVLSLIHI